MPPAAQTPAAPRALQRRVRHPHRRQEVRGQQLRQDRRVDGSVLTFASAIARVLFGFDTTTRPTRGSSRFAIASLFPVASSATWSSRRNPDAHPRNASGVTPIRPSSRTRPSSTTAS
jgi:hypothetical protein